MALPCSNPALLIAPAKVNMRLVVRGRRADGYHLLSMINVCADLADRLWVTPLDTPEVTLKERSTGSVALPGDATSAETNLASKAALKFLKQFAPGSGLSIELEKNIPFGAGLGGGSSDAAAILRFLWQHHAPKATTKTLYDLALSLGADVPYLLYGGLALVDGIGERVVPLRVPSPSPPRLSALLILPPWSISTPQLFAEYRSRSAGHALDKGEQVTGDLPAVIQEVSAESLVKTIRNDLVETIDALYPQSAQLLSALRAIPGIATSVTGSGSALFAIDTSQFISPQPAQPRASASTENWARVRAVADTFGARAVPPRFELEPLADGVKPPV